MDQLIRLLDDQEREIALETIRDINDSQINLLKIHIGAHQALRHIIALRLRADESELPKLDFMPTAKIALAGNGDRKLLARLQRLDSVRNEVGHSTDLAKYSKKLREFLRHEDSAAGKADDANLAELQSLSLDALMNLFLAVWAIDAVLRQQIVSTSVSAD